MRMNKGLLKTFILQIVFGVLAATIAVQSRNWYLILLYPVVCFCFVCSFVIFRRLLNPISVYVCTWYLMVLMYETRLPLPFELPDIEPTTYAAVVLAMVCFAIGAGLGSFTAIKTSSLSQNDYLQDTGGNEKWWDKSTLFLGLVGALAYIIQLVKVRTLNYAHLRVVLQYAELEGPIGWLRALAPASVLMAVVSPSKARDANSVANRLLLAVNVVCCS